MKNIITLTNLAIHVINNKQDKSKLHYDLERAKRGKSAWFESYIQGTKYSQLELAEAVETLLQR